MFPNGPCVSLGTLAPTLFGRFTRWPMARAINRLRPSPLAFFLDGAALCSFRLCSRHLSDTPSVFFYFVHSCSALCRSTIHIGSYITSALALSLPYYYRQFLSSSLLCFRFLVSSLPVSSIFISSLQSSPLILDSSVDQLQSLSCFLCRRASRFLHFSRFRFLPRQDEKPSRRPTVVSLNLSRISLCCRLSISISYPSPCLSPASSRTSPCATPPAAPVALKPPPLPSSTTLLLARPTSLVPCRTPAPQPPA